MNENIWNGRKKQKKFDRTWPNPIAASDGNCVEIMKRHFIFSVHDEPCRSLFARLSYLIIEKQSKYHYASNTLAEILIGHFNSAQVVYRRQIIFINRIVDDWYFSLSLWLILNHKNTLIAKQVSGRIVWWIFFIAGRNEKISFDVF